MGPAPTAPRIFGRHEGGVCPACARPREDPLGIGILRSHFLASQVRRSARDSRACPVYRPIGRRAASQAARPAVRWADTKGSRAEVDCSVSSPYTELGRMGALNGRNPSTVLDGFYGVQLGCLSQSAQSEDEALRTTVVESSTCEHHKSGTTQQRLLIRRLWQQRPSCLKPIHCTIACDKHAGETIANVVTSLPFIVLGLQTPRKNLNTAIYANSLVGMGIASSLYHSSKGEIRKFLRWADYTMIATTTLCLSRALSNENPRLLMAASALLLPFQPLMVSAVHTGLMEVSFARRASIEPELRMAHNLHKMSSLLGGALFIADDCFPETPYIHAAWHLAAAIGIVTCNKLLE